MHSISYLAKKFSRYRLNDGGCVIDQKPETPKDKSKAPGERQVQFDSTAKLILIPTISEYLQANIFSDIWSSKEDFTQYKKDAIADINRWQQETGRQGEPKELLKLYLQDLLEPRDEKADPLSSESSLCSP